MAPRMRELTTVRLRAACLHVYIFTVHFAILPPPPPPPPTPTRGFLVWYLSLNLPCFSFFPSFLLLFISLSLPLSFYLSISLFFSLSFCHPFPIFTSLSFSLLSFTVSLILLPHLSSSHIFSSPSPPLSLYLSPSLF